MANGRNLLRVYIPSFPKPKRKANKIFNNRQEKPTTLYSLAVYVVYILSAILLLLDFAMDVGAFRAGGITVQNAFILCRLPP